MKFNAVSIKNVVARIGRGEIFLPPIQRSFVWDRERIVNLFDSVYRDYPIGNCIFWRIKPETSKSYPLYCFTKEFSENKRAKIINEQAPRTSLMDDVYAIVDGQQRLSSFYIGLNGTYKYKKSGKGLQNVDANFVSSKLYINLMAQLQRGSEDPLFQFLSKEDAAVISEKQLCFEVGKAITWASSDRALDYFNNELLVNVLASNKQKILSKVQANKDAIVGVLASIFRMLHDNNLFYFDIDNQNLDEVVDVFSRINSGGMILKKSDLLFSILVAEWAEGRDEIRELVYSMRECGVDISQDFIMRSCLVLSGLRVKYNLESFKSKNTKIIKSKWADIKSSLMTLCEILPEIGYIDHPSLSHNALIPMAYYIMKGGKTNSTPCKQSLQRYYVISQIKGIFGGQSDQVLEKIRSEIDRQFTVGNILNIKDLTAIRLPGGKSMILTLEELNDLVEETEYGSPHAYFLLSLIYHTVDFKTRRYEVDHIHPRSKFNFSNLKNSGVDELEKHDEWIGWKRDRLPNLQLLGFKENASKKAKTIIEYLWLKDPAERTRFAKENLLPPLNSKTPFELSNFDIFFENRKKLLVKKLRSHFGL